VETYSRILVRATNWVGDAVMSLPALAAVRSRFPAAHIAILARPWVAGLYRHETFADEIIPYAPRTWADRLRIAGQLRGRGFDCAVLFQNAFEAALVAWLARIPRRIGYARDGRAWLLTHPVAPPRPGELHPHESFYYLNLPRSMGWVREWPSEPLVRLAGAEAARAAGRARLQSAQPVIGVSPGAAYGNAKRWFPERFAAAAAALAAELGARVALFGSPGERPLCEEVRLRMAGVEVSNFAGEIPLEEFIERAAACCLFLTNDSGAMHIASALGVPTVTVFGATNHITTGPTGPNARIVRRSVECSPCLLRECPIDHRCMAAVEVASVVETALELLQRN
jgi:heptosyltransferase-2